LETSQKTAEPQTNENAVAEPVGVELGTPAEATKEEDADEHSSADNAGEDLKE